MNKGFVILAVNNEITDYVKCAEALCLNIKYLMPKIPVTLVTDKLIDNNIFDSIIELPYGDVSTSEWKLDNDWQVYEASPYEYTIKLEADIFLPRPIDHYFDICKDRDLVVCNNIRNFKNEIVLDNFYRKIFKENNLPNLYNAITYFKKSDLSKEFFNKVKEIFYNWSIYRDNLICNVNEPATTDVVYAIASLIVGVENVVLPNNQLISMAHMKKMVNNLKMTDFTKELIIELDKNYFRLDTIQQLYPVHYHVKHFALDIYDTFRI
jgi:hypothetical protein